MRQSLSFNDVNLIPTYTDQSRKDVSLSASMGPYEFAHPFISANMDTITGAKMAWAMGAAGGLGILHRFCSIEDNIAMLRDVGALPKERVGVSIGVKEQEIERAAALYEAGARIICIDIAHGHSKAMGRMLKRLRQDFPNAFLIAGNVVTAAGADYLVSCGANAIKVGLGNGGVCKTRLATGVGVGQITAIHDCKRANATIISDGGVVTPGDACKALAAGAHFVMLGSFFAGCDETPGEVFCEEGPGPHPPLKIFRGMASREAQEDFMGKMEDWKTSEGVEIAVPVAGPVKYKISDLCGGLRSCLTYCGSSDILELHRKAEFIEVSNSGYIEGTPHAINRMV